MQTKHSETGLEIKDINKTYILIGRIAGVYGIKGWVKVESYTRPISNIAQYKTWSLAGPGDSHKEDMSDWSVLQCREHGKGLVAELQGINDRDEAMTLYESGIFIQRSQLPALEEGEYYWHDLIGLKVIDQNQSELGLLVEILETGANDVFVVEGESRVLIPWIDDVYVKGISLSKGCIYVDWPGDDR